MVIHKEDCIFCKIVKKEISAQLIFENENVVGFKDLNPSAPLHYLFVPKTHYESLAQIDDKNLNVMSELFGALLQVAELENIKEKGFRTVINTGKQGGQSVFHLHVHLLANKNMKHDFA